MRMKRLISAVTACVLLCGTVISVHAAEETYPTKETLQTSYDSADAAEYAEQVAILVNKERAAYGLQPLKVSPKLSEAANIRAGELKTSFSHTRPDGTSCFTAMDELGITYRAAAENIAYGQRNPESVMNAWMNSSGHRANILSDKMEYIGIGAVYREGVWYWSQFFAASEVLSEGAYLPGENNAAISTTAKPVTTTQQTTTTTRPAVTTEQTSTDRPVTTTTYTATEMPASTQTTASYVTTTAVQTTAVAQSTESATVTQTTTCPPDVPDEIITTCQSTVITDCITVVTRPAFSFPSSGGCFTVGGGAVVVIYPK